MTKLTPTAMMEYPGEQKPDYRSPTQFGGSMDEGDSNDSALSLLDEKREKHLIRKIDLHIIPFVVLLYLFSFLDRGGRVYFICDLLCMSGFAYKHGFDATSNAKLRPSRYIATISVLWGIIATLTGITQNYGGLIACRILLGYKREIALRTGYLFSSAAAAGAFGGLLAYGIGFMDGVAGLRDDLDTAYYLDDEEKALVVRLRRRDVGQTSSAQKFHWADVKEGALDWRIYAFCIAQFGVDTMLYGYSTFLPTIIQGMGSWSTPEVQALTIPCYARTFATGLQLTFGNVSGVMSPFLYKTNEAPRYVRGNAVTLSLVGFAGIVYGLMWWYYYGKNKRREQGLEDEKIVGIMLAHARVDNSFWNYSILLQEEGLSHEALLSCRHIKYYTKGDPLYFPRWSTTSFLRRSAPETTRVTSYPGATFTKKSGPFGKRRNARYEHTRSRTRTGTPAAKRENPNVAEFGRLFAQQQEEEKARSNTLPKSSSASNLDNARKQQTEKVATECILYGYKSKDFEWKVIDKYERISRGFICEDYPRTDPNASNGYSQLLSGGDVVIRANLSADANRKSKRYAGGFHWIKVTFDSTTAADRACFYSPQEIDGHLVFCELYHGQGPAEDAPIVQGSAEATRLQSKAAPRTLTSSHSTSFLQPKDTATKERHTLPRSFASNNLSSILDAHEEESQESSSTPTASSATATAIEQPAPLQQRTVVKEPKPESDFMTHIPTVRRTKLRPITEALPPQPTVTERVLRSIPILSWFTGDIVGDGPQLREDGAFDFDKSNTYWKFWYMVDRILGTDICGLKEES
ncbi:hypothetical protein BDQ94DRAFT_181713 [Aspergillus welwitschiae]|uniref:Major facilitator superfamily domain-containing protein n=1 Tax=Aspergillus welwitschiae TaxID=1341132 RepID=A0A3F3PU10_9EURO|nr:hypothetical protein BDQ94DRAFT_181713 [Aspergillus welwitschiae]RDH30427.1 hypothetical protein BDQ94DRAFT_181713 [Aspergillus welwitschiae]